MLIVLIAEMGSAEQASNDHKKALSYYEAAEKLYKAKKYKEVRAMR